MLEEKPHPVFQREGHDLIMNMEIELVEALCGFKRCITHLDNRTVTVNCARGEVTREGDIKCVVGEGMPIFKHPEEKGRLLIKFRVRFPQDNFANPDELVCRFSFMHRLRLSHYFLPVVRTRFGVVSLGTFVQIGIAALVQRVTTFALPWRARANRIEVGPRALTDARPSRCTGLVRRRY